MKKKYAFTLLELLLSCFLFSILSATFFFWMHSHVLQKKEFEKTKWPIVEERYFYERVDRLFSASVSDMDGEERRCQFSFDNGVYSHPLLSHRTTCLLTQEDDRIICTLSPLEERGDGPTLSFTLLDRIKELSFSYYQPIIPSRLEVDPEKVGKSEPPQGEEITIWRPEYKRVPAYVKMTMVREERTIEMFFDLDYPIQLIGGLS